MELLKYIRSNISNLIFILFIAVIFFSTDARAILIRGIMFTGLFNAEASSGIDKSAANRSIPASMTFRSEDGELINISENKGKVYFINFWATWCPPCRAEMPSINALASKIKNKDKISFIMVDVDNKMDASVKFMKKRSFNLKVYTSETPIPTQIFNGTLPTTVIIGPDGSIVFHHTGMADYDNKEMINFLNTLTR
ncbi:Thiol-disulfide isomerase or thioredoxin [Daejeonella rubra]|uniref:Thiol-disulfide isomerase or thioredoxin n=1 Tax=Daejeonella rubra TaxID=990371 RepID=A0A1G9VTM4_9SPHI|nr:TlpA disulfide reductase family protein [Daejeonella rubra]SDM75513.1 Thiol-disulfide isomerase or thioredoxin [Daejeonella rubra]